MKPNHFLLVAILLVGMMFSIGGVMAIECGSTPTDGCTVSTSTTFDGGTYYLNGTSSGAIRITGSNLILDCNNSIFIGNNTSPFYGLDIGNRQNIVVKNCIFKEYYRLVSLGGTTNNNITLSNLTLLNNTNVGLIVSGSSNILIENSVFRSTYPYSNDTSGKVLITSNSKNISIVNSNFTNDNMGSAIFIRSDASTTSNITLIENRFVGAGNLTTVPVAVRLDAAHNGLTMNNNYFQNVMGLRVLNGAENISINNNIIANSYALMRGTNVTNVIIDSNIVNNSRLLYSGAVGGTQLNFTVTNNNVSNTNLNIPGGDLGSSIYLYANNTNFIISNNRFFNTTGGFTGVSTAQQAGNFIKLDTVNINNLSIINNLFNYSSLALTSTNTLSSIWINISNNEFYNALGNYDSYSNHILLFKISNVTIGNNIFRDACNPIQLQKTTNINVISNNFDMNETWLINNRVNCAHEPFVAIGIQELWKGWEPSGTTAQNIASVSQMKSSNIIVSGNSFGSYPIMLRTQGTQSLTHDLTNYWLRSFQTPTYLIDRDVLYINNSFNNINNVYNETANNNQVSINYIMANNFHNSLGNIQTKWSIFNNYMWFQNYNQTSSLQTNFYNLTNSLIVYDNQTSIPVYGTNQEINLTLAPNQYVYVYTNTTTICDDLGNCSMNVTIPGGGTSFNYDEKANNNLTFTDNDANFLTKFYRWFVDGILQLYGYGENVFSYVFNLNVANPSDTINMVNGYTGLCYQESSNESDQSGTDSHCGQFYNGTYELNWVNAGSGGANTIDGNYGTGTVDTINGDYLYINYTKPTGVLNATWQVKDQGGATTTRNLTIPSSCFNYSQEKVSLLVNGSSPHYLNYYCYNGSWVSVSSQRPTDIFYEEGIFWYVNNSITITNTSFLITENTANPKISIIYPSNGVNYTQDAPITDLNYSFSDETDSVCKYSINGGTNNTITCGTNVTNMSINTTGSYTIRLYANDSVGNTNVSTSTFYYNSNPTINLSYPTALIDYGKLNDTLELNFTATDTNLDSVSYSYYADFRNQDESENYTYNIINKGEELLYIQRTILIMGSPILQRNFYNLPSNCIDEQNITIYSEKVGTKNIFSCKVDNSNNHTLAEISYFKDKPFEIVSLNKRIAGAVSGEYNISNITLSTKKNVTIYANDTAGNVKATTFSWDYKVFENSRTHNISSFETANEGYSINVSSNSSLTGVSLLYNSTSYPMSQSGSVWSYSRDLPSSTLGNNSVQFNFTYQGSGFLSDLSYQNISPISLAYCSSGTPYINFTFKDEQTLTSMNATVDSSVWSYWLGTGDESKSLLYSNTTSENPSYAFCFTPSTRAIGYDLTVQFASDGYPQRRYSVESGTLTNTTTNRTLYLLSSGDGIYVTFSLIDTSSSEPISGVTVTADRSISGETIRVGEEVSDSAGGVTFWLNPNYEHTFIFSKTGCSYVTQTIRPTQSSYTQTLTCDGSSTTVVPGTLDGIRYQRTPMSGILSPGTYNFTYFIMSERQNIAGAKFELYDTSSSTVLATNTSSCSPEGCLLTLNYTMVKGQNIKGRYYVDLGDGWILVEGDAFWRFISTNVSDSGTVKSFWQDLMNFFDTTGTGQTECAVYKNETSCEDNGCKWITQTTGSTSISICIPADTENKKEYSRIMAFFIFMAIIIAGLNHMTQVDSFNPGIAMFFMTAIVGIGSMANGYNGVGYFYLNALTANSIFNNWAIFIMFAMFTLATWEASRARNG